MGHMLPQEFPRRGLLAAPSAADATAAAGVATTLVATMDEGRASRAAERFFIGTPIRTADAGAALSWAHRVWLTTGVSCTLCR